MKPGHPTEIRLRVRNFLKYRSMYQRIATFSEELEHKVVERTQALWESQVEIVERLSRACEFRDTDTGEHATRVAELAASIASEYGLPRVEVELIRLAAPLHDIGKVSVPDSILLKRGSLTTEEFAKMRTHSAVGAALLSGGRTPLLKVAETVASSHHERWDGTGYSKALIGQEIPIEGRIVAVADVYDSLTNERPYRKPIRRADAIAHIVSLSGVHFDPQVVAAFLRVSADTACLSDAA